MDPLSLSASIAGLVSLADLVFHWGTKFIKGYKGSQKEIGELLREVKTLSAFLYHLELVTSDLEESEPGSLESTSHLRPNHLHDCQQLLNRLHDGLSEFRLKLHSDSGFERLKVKLKWPFSSEQTREMMQDLERHKQMINTALAADSLSKLKQCLSNQEELGRSIEELQLDAKKILDIQTKIALDERREKILNFFAKVDPRTEYDTNRNLRHGLTGLWLTRGADFEEWYTVPGSKMWCSGIAGAGKSVLAAAIIEECLQRNASNPSVALAFFFCIYGNSETHDLSTILSSLCAQLALQDERAFRILEGFYEELNPYQYRSTALSTDRLIENLLQMSKLYGQTYIVIDGLDECGAQSEQNTRLLSRFATSQQEDINLALLSRDEYFIREHLKHGFHNVEIEAHTDDIQLYVASELERRIKERRLRLRNPTLKDEIQTQLVNQSKGMFRWVVCQLDHICGLPRDSARRRALKDLPPTLPATYERILKKVEDESNEEVKLLVRRTLLLISAPSTLDSDPLTIQQICEAVSLSDDLEYLDEDDMFDEEDILRWCGSLVRISKHNTIEFAHFSVQEYLQHDYLKRSELHEYSITPEKTRNLLESLCLRFLNLENYDQLPASTEEDVHLILEREKSQPFYNYAAMNWLFYIFLNPSGDKCSPESLLEFFDSSKTARFCCWTIEFIRHCSECIKHNSIGSVLEIISAVLRPDLTPLHMAAVLGIPDLCHHLLKEGANPNVRSRFGTPFHCAIGGITVFFNLEGTGQSKSYPDLNFNVKGLSPLARRQTVQLLLDVGAEPGLQLQTPFRTSTPFALALGCHEGGFEIIVDIANMGVAVEEKDLNIFAGHFETLLALYSPEEFKAAYKNSTAYLDLLNALRSRQTMNAPTSTLCKLTADFAKRMRLEKPNLASKSMLGDGASDEETCEYICTLIENNDSVGIDKFLQSDKAELIKSVGINTDEPSWTTVHLAVFWDSPDVLKSLLGSGINPNEACEDGMVPLHYCVINKNVDLALVLLEYGASTIRADKNNETVWHHCARNDWAKMLEILCEHTERDEALKMVSVTGETPICGALVANSEASVLLLLKYCNSIQNWKAGNSMFRAATRMGSSLVVQKLLDVGVEADDMEENGQNSLHEAAITGQDQILEIFLENELFASLDAFQNSPMHYAAFGGQSSTIELLDARGENLNRKNGGGQTPLHFAAEQGQLGAVKTLIRLGATQQLCNDGSTPVSYAHMSGNKDVIAALTTSLTSGSTMEASISSPAMLGQMADTLRIAIDRDDVKACANLHAAGCPVDIEFDVPWATTTPLFYAIAKDSFEVAQWLLAKGANVSTPNVPPGIPIPGMAPLPSFETSITALEIAASKQRFNSLLPALIAKNRHEGGNFVNLRLLHLAIDCGNIEGLEIALEALKAVCSSLNTTSTTDLCFGERSRLATFVSQREPIQPMRSPLHVAAQRNNVTAILILVDAGARLEGRDMYNHTPLHYGASQNFAEAVTCLLGLGARVDAVSTGNTTPFLMACDNGNWELAKLLAPDQFGTETSAGGANGLQLLLQNKSNRYENPQLKFFHMFLDEGFDLHQKDLHGVAPIHWLLVSPASAYLRSLLNRDARLLQLQKLDRWPDQVFTQHPPGLTVLAKNLRVLRYFVGSSGIQHLSGLESPGTHDLLCRAACWGYVEAIEHLIAAGAACFSHQCHCHGTPLEAAIAHGHVEAVKCLVRNGAAVPYAVCNAKNPRISISNPEFLIRQWLFLGRQLDRKRISNDTSTTTKDIKTWAGIWRAKVPVKYEWRKRRCERMVEYAGFRQRLPETWRGEVVESLGFVGEPAIKAPSFS